MAAVPSAAAGMLPSAMLLQSPDVGIRCHAKSVCVCMPALPPTSSHPMQDLEVSPGHCSSVLPVREWLVDSRHQMHPGVLPALVDLLTTAVLATRYTSDAAAEMLGCAFHEATKLTCCYFEVRAPCAHAMQGNMCCGDC